MILLRSGIVGGCVRRGCRQRLLLILAWRLILIKMIRMMIVGMGMRVWLTRSWTVRVWMRMRVRVRATPGVILLPGSGGIHARHPIAFFASHSDHGQRSLLDASLKHSDHLSLFPLARFFTKYTRSPFSLLLSCLRVSTNSQFLVGFFRTVYR